MRRVSLLLFGCVAVALAMTPPFQSPRPERKPLAELMPAGALLYLEARDFAGLLDDWGASPERTCWLESDNYRVFERSRLYLRLKDAQAEFATVAGLPADLLFLRSFAGTEAAMALYDIGNLEFLYVTRMPAPRMAENLLWRTREKFEPRTAAGIPYYFRKDQATRKTAAFATTDEYLLLATREDVLVDALGIIAGKAASVLKDENWYDQATRTAGAAGDLRLALNLEALVRKPHFRSYWIQRNVSEIKQYTAEIADIHRSATEIREDRLILRSNPGQSPTDTSDPKAPGGQLPLSQVMALIPDGAGFYRAWTDPTVETALGLLERKILAPRIGPGVPSRYAPSALLREGRVGGEDDLETRIDIPPYETGGNAPSSGLLKELLEKNKPKALLQLQSAHRVTGGVFVTTESTIVLEGSADWDNAAVRAALVSACQNLLTTSRLGLNWVASGESANASYQLDGLAHLASASKGRFLIIANADAAVQNIMARVTNPPVSVDGVYAAGFRRGQEWQDYRTMLRLIETPFTERLVSGRAQNGREPLFFSENLASLGDALKRVDSISVLTRDRGPFISETVTYKLSP